MSTLPPLSNELSAAFPSVEPGIEPCGSRVLLQIRTPKKYKGSVLLPDDSRDTEKWNTQVGRVINLGPLAFKNRNTLESWKEGAWTEVGDFVRFPKYGGDKWEVTGPDGEEVLFLLVNDLDVLGRVTGDPLAIKAYL
jgi:co-chaperonin GroES (HSP10)